ncbi:MAG: helix-turn-helix domain-containing protein [Planctomycetota bacterium]|jgi:excisionase family DNA binding protein
MAPKYYSSEETAKALGLSEDEVKQMAQRQELHGYRDGAQLKFKAEDVDRLLEQRAAGAPETSGEDEGDVLLSELELGPSASGGSGTVIGGVEGGGKPAADSDLKLGEESEPPGTAAGQLDSKVAQFEELDRALEEDLTLEDSQVTPGEEAPSGGSSVDVAGGDLEDDDLVLGGSGAGSDITIGGDSGISLVDPADSGLSLEEPLGTAASTDESLELGEDDLIGLAEPADADSPTELKTDDDFLLTPLEEVSEDEDSESGSQVIALDLEGDEAATMIADGPGGSGVAAMLDEDVSPEPAADMGLGAAVDAAALGAAPLGTQPGAFVEGAPLAQTAALPETPYTVWNILSLVFCSIFLMLVGMMMYDLLRNMWSWDGAYEFNSWIMDLILGR